MITIILRINKTGKITRMIMRLLKPINKTGQVVKLKQLMINITMTKAYNREDQPQHQILVTQVVVLVQI